MKKNIPVMMIPAAALVSAMSADAAADVIAEPITDVIVEGILRERGLAMILVAAVIVVSVIIIKKIKRKK